MIVVVVSATVPHRDARAQIPTLDGNSSANLKPFLRGNPSLPADADDESVSQVPGYRLSANDTVEITVFGEDELFTRARVGKDGAVNFPMVGLVKIAGQGVRQAAQTLEERLKIYLKKPHVAVSILSYSKRRFTILGEINKPGAIELPDETSINLLEAIGMAGGYTRIANPSKITLKRQVGSQENVYKLDAKKMAEGAANETLKILPGDTIVVGQRIF